MQKLCANYSVDLSAAGQQRDSDKINLVTDSTGSDDLPLPIYLLVLAQVVTCSSGGCTQIFMKLFVFVVCAQAMDTKVMPRPSKRE